MWRRFNFVLCPLHLLNQYLQIISDNLPIQTTLTTHFMSTSVFTVMLREVSILWESSFSVLPGSIWMNYLMTFLLKKSHDVEHFLTVNIFTVSEDQNYSFWWITADGFLVHGNGLFIGQRLKKFKWLWNQVKELKNFIV